MSPLANDSQGVVLAMCGACGGALEDFSEEVSLERALALGLASCVSISVACLLGANECDHFR
jgi:hypothetical protein